MFVASDSNTGWACQLVSRTGERRQTVAGSRIDLKLLADTHTAALVAKLCARAPESSHRRTFGCPAAASAAGADSDARATISKCNSLSQSVGATVGANSIYLNLPAIEASQMGGIQAESKAHDAVAAAASAGGTEKYDLLIVSQQQWRQQTG